MSKGVKNIFLAPKRFHDIYTVVSFTSTVTSNFFVLYVTENVLSVSAQLLNQHTPIKIAILAFSKNVVTSCTRFFNSSCFVVNHVLTTALASAVLSRALYSVWTSNISHSDGVSLASGPSSLAVSLSLTVGIDEHLATLTCNSGAT